MNVYNTSCEILFKLLFTEDITSECDFSSYSSDMISVVINPENALTPEINLMIHGKGCIIEFYSDNSFILYGRDICGGNRVPNKQMMKSVLNAIINKCSTIMTIREFIELAVCKVIDTKSELIGSCLDLSLGKLTTRTLFDLLDLNVKC